MVRDDIANYLNNLNKPSHISNEYKYYKICKVFKKKECLNSFIEGNLYMSTLDSLSTYKSESFSEGQYDDFEATEVF